MKGKVAIIFTVLFSLVLVGCGEKKLAARAIKDTDTCDICNMQVADNQFATQIILSDEQVLTFDDLGCLHKWEKENGTKKVAATFIRDFESKKWMKAEDATYVYGMHIKTPMGYGVVSFKDSKKADEYAKEHNGKILNYDQLKEHDWKQMKMKMNM
ncbi:MAG: nitrous oxide reductase accessory protein NosL [Bacillaceae bacterium]